MFGRKTPEIQLQEGCKGVARQVVSEPLSDAAKSSSPERRTMHIAFACAGLAARFTLNETTAQADNPGWLGRAKRAHADVSAVDAAHICNRCPLGPAAQARRDLELERAALTSLDRQIRLAELQAENRTLQARNKELEQARQEPEELPPGTETSAE